MLKFQRNYRCVLEIGRVESNDLTNPIIEETIEITYPITLLGGVNRHAFAEANTASLQFLNISPQYRSKLWKDGFNSSKYVGVSLYAGYGDTMPLIFKGYANCCYSYKRGGDADFVTEIQATDAGFLLEYGLCNITAAKNSTMDNILQSLLNDVPDVQVGFVSEDTTYIGQPFDLLYKDFSKYQVFIDLGNLHVLENCDVVPGEVYTITSNSGLLGSPKRNEVNVEADILFEPGLRVGQQVILLSDSIENLNQAYKVIGISHQFVISARQAGQATTRVILNRGEGVFNELKRMSNEDYNIGGNMQGWIKPVSASITSRFGATSGRNHMHTGIDYGCPIGTPVKAIYNGTVIFNGLASGYGRAIYINHGKIGSASKVVSEYGHLSDYNVYNGQRVSTGTVIGYSGNTGHTTGPHLHLTIRENGRAVNPAKYIGN